MLEIIPRAILAGFTALLRILTGPWSFYRKIPKEWKWAEPAAFFIITGLITTLILCPAAFRYLEFSLETFNLVTVAGLFVSISLAIVLAILSWPLSIIYKSLGAREWGLPVSFQSLAFCGTVLPIAAVLLYAEKIPVNYRYLIIGLYGTCLLGASATELHRLKPVTAWGLWGTLAIIGCILFFYTQAKETLARRATETVMDKLANQQFERMVEIVRESRAKEFIEREEALKKDK